MATVKPQEKRIHLNGMNFLYMDWGNVGAPNLLCLHGYGSQARVFDEFAEVMSARYHVLALNQRGHGGSGWASDGYARDRFVDDLASFIDVLDLAPVTLVGLSMGGWHSILYAPEHPGAVTRIIIGDIAPQASDAFVEFWLNRPEIPLEFPDVDAALRWGRGTNPRVSDEHLRKDVLDKVYQRADGIWTHKADPKILQGALDDLTDQRIIDRYWEALGRIDCPILHVRGGLSPLVSDEVNVRMGEVAADFRSVDIPDSGHPLTTEKPLEFIEATRAFLGF